MTSEQREELKRLWAENMKAYAKHLSALGKYEKTSRAYWKAWEDAGGMSGACDSLRHSSGADVEKKA